MKISNLNTNIFEAGNPLAPPGKNWPIWVMSHNPLPDPQRLDLPLPSLVI